MFYFIITVLIMDILLIPYLYIKYNKLNISYKESALVLLDKLGYLLILVLITLFVIVLLLTITFFTLPILSLYYI